MIITCKQCATDYFLDENRIKPSGSKVKCSKCQNLFIAFPPAKNEETSSTGEPQTSEIQSPEEDRPTGPTTSSVAGSALAGTALAGAALSGSEDKNMPDLAAGLDELLGSDITDDQPVAGALPEIDEPDVKEIENQEMHDLTDELDKILGSDDETAPPVEKDKDASLKEIMEPDLEEDDENLESGFLDDEFDQVFGENQADKTTTPADDTSSAYDTNIEMLNLSELDDELDEMFTPEVSVTDTVDETMENMPASDGEIDLDTIQIQDLDSELENIEEISSSTNDDINFDMLASESEDILESEPPDINSINLEDLDISDPVEDKADAEQDSIENENNFLDTKQIEKLDLDLDLEYLEEQDNESSSPNPGADAPLDDHFVLDTKQIKTLDLELDLEDLETTDSVDTNDGTENASAKDDSLTPDSLPGDGFDLELEDIETSETSDEADFSLDTQQIDGLDLEFEELEPSDAIKDSDSPDEMPEEETPLSLDTEQIRSLDLELEDIETTEPAPESESEPEPEDNFDKDVSITLDTTKGKQTEVLNVNLERPDLDDTFSEDEEIDLPILDQLLAPAEVVDESLAEAPTTEADSELTLADEKEAPTEAVVSAKEEDILGLESDQLSIEPESLDLEGIDFEKKADAEKAIESDTFSMPKDEEIPLEQDTFQMEKAAPKDTQTTTDTDTITPFAGAEDLPVKKSRKSLILLLLIALLLAGLYLASMMGIKIPYVSNLMTGNTQQVADSQGISQLETNNIDSKFITNKHSGRLFIITGKVINQYDHPRGAILIKGNIFAKGGKQIKGKSSYCGNILSDLDLSVKPFDEIQKYLSAKSGHGGAGSLKADPGKTIPFMIAFEGLPDDIEEFSVELIHSQKL